MNGRRDPNEKNEFDRALEERIRRQKEADERERLRRQQEKG